MTALLFLCSFLYSLLGASGTIPAYRDSGDLVASIYTLGIAHPPGYSLYVLLGKLFVTLVPFGNVAYRVNAMSAFFAAGTVAVLYRFMSSPTATGGGSMDPLPKTAGDDKRIRALAISLVLASAPAFLSLSRVAEMYTLSAFLAACILALLWSDLPKATAWAALLLGLGLSVHPTLIFLAPLFLVRPAQTFRWQTLVYLLIGLSVFLYLPLRAMQNPALNWGDPSHWRNFWRVVTRADYGGMKLHPVESVFEWTPASLWAQTLFFIKTFQAQVGKVAFLLGAIGLLGVFRGPGNKAGAWGLLLSWLLSGPAFVLLSNLPIQEPSTPAILEPYLLIPLVLWIPFIRAGCDVILEASSSKSWVVPVTLVLMLSIKPWVWATQRNDFYAYDYARNLLRMLPPDAVLYDPDDPTHFTIQAIQLLEGRRADVTLLSFFRTRWGYEQIKKRSPALLPAIPIDNAQQLERLFWSYSALKRPFCADLPVKLGATPYHVEGLAYAAQVGKSQATTPAGRETARSLLDQAPARGDMVVTNHQDFFLRHLIDYYASAHSNLGLEYAAARDWPAAIDQYQEALNINPGLSAAWNNLGIVAFERGDYPAAQGYFQRALDIEPNSEMLQKNKQLAGQKMAKNL